MSYMTRDMSYMSRDMPYISCDMFYMSLDMNYMSRDMSYMSSEVFKTFLTQNVTWHVYACKIGLLLLCCLGEWQCATLFNFISIVLLLNFCEGFLWSISSAMQGHKIALKGSFRILKVDSLLSTVFEDCEITFKGSFKIPKVDSI